MPGPDFPTGGIILGREGIRSAYHDRPRLDRDARQGRDRDHPQGARSDHHLGNSVPGEQGHDDRAHGRAGAREEDRRHRRAARRIRPRRLPRRDRAQARGHGRRGAQPALPLHAAADLVRRQHGGARRRPSAGDEPQGHADRVHRVPRGRDLAAHQVPARQGARPRPHPGRSRHRGRQHRRGDQAHPRLEGRQRGARQVDGARMAGQHRGRADRADRRSAPSHVVGRHRQADRRADQGDPRSAPAAADRARPRRDQGRARQARQGDFRLSRHPALARAHPGDRQGRADGRQRRVRHAAPHRDRRAGGRGRGRRPDPPRGHGGDGVASRLRQARAALDLPDAAPRRQRPLRHADARRGFRQPAVRRLDAHAGAVLLLARPRLQGKGLAAADRGAAGARQAADQHPADRAGRADDLDPAAARGRNAPGAIST